jgi:small nuclear ribonucleoprotein (snRNP)-like protein
MRYEEIKEYDGKRVQILLKNNYRYTGTITKVNPDSLVLNDKYEQDVLISLEEISVLQEYFGGTQ